MPLIGSMPGTETSLGWISFAAFFVPLLSSIIGNLSNSLRRIPLVLSLVASLIAGAAGCLQLYVLLNPPEPDEYDPFSALFQEHFTIGFGLYILIITAFAIPIVAFLLKEKQPTTAPIARPKKKTAVKPVVEPKEDVKPEKVSEIKKEDKEDHSRFMPS